MVLCAPVVIRQRGEAMSSYSRYSIQMFLILGLTSVAACSGRESDNAVSLDEETPSGASAELPDGFPDRFPFPKDFAIREARFTPGSATTQASFLVRGSSSTSLQDLGEFYSARLPESGFEIIQQQINDGNGLFYFQDDEFRDCTVQLRDNTEGTQLLVNLPLRD
jgi:hypothetical protein